MRFSELILENMNDNYNQDKEKQEKLNKDNIKQYERARRERGEQHSNDRLDYEINKKNKLLTMVTQDELPVRKPNMFKSEPAASTEHKPESPNPAASTEHKPESPNPAASTEHKPGPNPESLTMAPEYEIPKTSTPYKPSLFDQIHGIFTGGKPLHEIVKQHLSNFHSSVKDHFSNIGTAIKDNAHGIATHIAAGATGYKIGKNIGHAEGHAEGHAQGHAQGSQEANQKWGGYAKKAGVGVGAAIALKLGYDFLKGKKKDD